MYNYELKKILFKYYYCIILILILNCNFLSAMRHAQEPTRPAQAAGAAAATSMYGYQHGMPLPPVLQHAAARAASHGVVGLDVDLENLSLTSATGSPTSSSSTAPVAGVKHPRETSGAATSEVVDIKRQRGSSGEPESATQPDTSSSSSSSSSSSDEVSVVARTPGQELAAAQERNRIDALIMNRLEDPEDITSDAADKILADVRYPSPGVIYFGFLHASAEVFRNLFKKLTPDEKRAIIRGSFPKDSTTYPTDPAEIPRLVAKIRVLLENGAPVSNFLNRFTAKLALMFYNPSTKPLNLVADYIALLDLLASYGANFSEQSLSTGSLIDVLINLPSRLASMASGSSVARQHHHEVYQMIDILLSRARQLDQWRQRVDLAARGQHIQQIMGHTMPAELIGSIRQYDTIDYPLSLPAPLPDQAITPGSPLDQYLHPVSTTQRIASVVQGAAQRLYTSTSQAANTAGRTLLGLGGRSSGGQ